MDRQVFEQFRTLIHKESGIYLTDEKVSLLTNRLAKRLRATGTTTAQEYLQLLGLDTSGEELIELIDAISTNVTHFFREADHFTFLAERLKEYRDQRRQSVKIWCAASSTGEEPYTLAMVAAEAFRGTNITWNILATDICTKVLRHAHAGHYSDQSIQSIPEEFRRQYCTRSSDDPALPWAMHPQLKERIVYRKFNLAQFPYRIRNGIDIVFCRNVMIYFKTPLRQQIINEMKRIITPGGVLVLSHSENLLAIEHQFLSCGRSIFLQPASSGSRMSI